jgi:hypothetical protein
VPIELHVEPGVAAARGLAQVKFLAWEHPGEHELTVVICGREHDRRLKLGGAWLYDASPACLAALGEFGGVRVVASG